LLYAIFFIVYWITLGIWKEIVDLQKIGNVLANATNISLPCSMNYYEHVYYLEISHFSSVIIFPVVFFLFGYIIEPKHIELKLLCLVFMTIGYSSSK
jgi:hypothetical protein